MRFFLRPRAPYDFGLHQRFYSRRREAPQPEIFEAGVWRRAFRVGRRLLPVEVRSVGEVGKPLLEVNVPARVSGREKRALLGILREAFSLDYDLRPAYSLMRRDGRLKPLIRKLRGLTPERMAKSVFEGVVKAIVQQQISLAVAYVMTGCLVERFGEKVKVGGKEYYDFPTAERLAEAGIGDLTACKLSKRKAEYIRDFAGAVVGGYDVEGLAGKRNEEVIAELTKFRGIGVWSAELVLVAVLGRLDAIPADDLAVRRAVSNFFFEGRRISAERMRRLAKGWGRQKGIIAYYILCAEKVSHDAENCRNRPLAMFEG